MCSVGEVVFPGDILSDLKKSEKSGKSVVGPGICVDDTETVVTKAGILRFKEPNYYWVDCHQKRYVPVKGDHVLGIVASKAGDIFKVDVGGSEYASLSYLAFEGSTKRNRPDVKVGDVVYARFLAASKDMEAELVCIDGLGKSSGLGVIRDGGFLFYTSLNLTRKILSPSCKLLKLLGKSLHYEVAVGTNGRVWVKGRSSKDTIALANAISSAEYMDSEQISLMVRQLSNALAGF